MREGEEEKGRKRDDMMNEENVGRMKKGKRESEKLPRDNRVIRVIRVIRFTRVIGIIYN